MTPDKEPVSLAELVDRLPATLSVTTAPAGLQTPVGEPVILDPAEPLPAVAGGILLAVGTDSERALVTLLERLPQSPRPAAVVVKRIGVASVDVVGAARASGVAVLAAPDELPWGRLHALLLTAMRSGPGSPEIPDVPLGDLFALVNAVAAMVGGAATIEDPNSAVLAYSSLGHPIDDARQATILGRQIPDDWMIRLQQAGAMRQLWQSDGVVRVEFDDLPGYLTRLAVGVRAGGEFLGSIWVVEGDQPLDAEAERRLRAAADIAALHLLRHRGSHDVVRQRRADALLQLLDGEDRGERAQTVLGLDPQQPAAVVGFDVGADDATGRVAAGRIADLAAMHFEAYRRSAVCAVQGARVYALLPLSGGAEKGIDSVHQLAQAIVERAASALRVDVVAGIGSVAAGITALAGARREADQAIDVLRRDRSRLTAEAPAVADIGQVRAKAVLRRLGELAQQHSELREGRLDAMVAQDASKSTEWVPTLRAYFDAFGDMVAAAAAVNVHPNTFRYRLRRIREVFGIDLDDPDERLVVELQLRFLETAPPAAGAADIA